MQRGEAGIEDIGIRALLEQEQRERHMPATVATSSGVLPAERVA